MITTAIVEDDKFIRDSLAELLNEADGFKCSGAYNSCEAALEDIRNNKP